MNYYDYNDDYSWEEDYDSTWEEENPPENKKPKRYHQKNKSWNRAARDMQNYRHGYGNEFMPSADYLEYMPNLEFYQNKIEFRPNGCKIEEMFYYWKEDYATLESNHSFIQCHTELAVDELRLFPLQEHGVNPYAVPLKMNEIKIMKKDKDVMRRFLISYKLMLGFYGIKLLNEEDGTVVRAENWEDRFKNLNNRSHNNLRITRILKCLGELGYERFQAPLVRFFLEETLCKGQLQNVKRSVLDYFMFTVKDKCARKKLVHFAWLHYKPQDEFIWGPVEKLRDYSPDEEKKIKENETEGCQNEKEDLGKLEQNCDMGNYESQGEGEPANVLQSNAVSDYGNTDYTHLEKDKNENNENERKKDISSEGKNEENDDTGENKQGVKDVGQTGGGSAKEEDVCSGTKTVPEQHTSLGNDTGTVAAKSTVNDKQMIEKGESDMNLLTESGDKEYEERTNKTGVKEPIKQHISGSNDEENDDLEGENKQGIKEVGQTEDESGKEEDVCSGTKIVLEQPTSLGNDTGTVAAKSAVNNKQMIEKGEFDFNLLKESGDKDYVERANKTGVKEPRKWHISGRKNEENDDLEGDNKHRLKEVGQTRGESGKTEAVCSGPKTVPEQPTSLGNDTGTEAAKSTGNEDQVIEEGESESMLIKESGDNEHEEIAKKNGVIECKKWDVISGSNNEVNDDIQGENKHRVKGTGQIGGESGKENTETKIMTVSDINLVKNCEDKDTECLENKKLLESDSGTEYKNCCSICWYSICNSVLSFGGCCCHICLFSKKLM